MSMVHVTDTSLKWQSTQSLPSAVGCRWTELHRRRSQHEACSFSRAYRIQYLQDQQAPILENHHDCQLPTDR